MVIEKMSELAKERALYAAAGAANLSVNWVISQKIE